MSSLKPYRMALDLFAGAGGWDVRAEELGLIVHGVEVMSEALATRKAAGLKTVHTDVWTMPTHLLEYYDGLIASPPCQTFSSAGSGAGRKALDDVLALIGLVETFSTLQELQEYGELLGDERTALVLTPLWYALNMPNVTWLAWEQVPPVLPVWEACAVVLRARGWNVWTGFLQAEQYGVAQTRKRAFLIASTEREVGKPEPTHSKYYSRNPEKLDAGVLKWVSMAEALSVDAGSVGFPRRSDGRGEDVVIDGIAYRGRDLRDVSHPSQVVIEKARSWVLVNDNQPNASRREMDKPASTVAFGHAAGDVKWLCAAGRTGAGAPRSNSDPSPTLTGKGNQYWIDDLADYTGPRYVPQPAIEGEKSTDCGWVEGRSSSIIVGSFRPDVVAKPGYRKAGDPPRQKTPGSVRITVEEAAILQSFPEDHPWQGAKTKQFLQVGNAVPPGLALAVLSEATGISLAQPVELDLAA